MWFLSGKHPSLQAALKATKQKTNGRDEEVVALCLEFQVNHSKNTGVVEFFYDLQ